MQLFIFFPTGLTPLIDWQVLVTDGFNIVCRRLLDRFRRIVGNLIELLFQDPSADIDAAVANIDARAGNELFDFCVALAAEGTHGQVGSSCHRNREVSRKKIRGTSDADATITTPRKMLS